MRSFSWVTSLRWGAGALGATYLIVFGLLGFLVGPWDHNHLASYYDLAWRHWEMSPALSLPQYNPYLCGGRTLGGDPQIPIYHPLLILVPLLGAPVAIKLEMLCQLALGCWGLWGCLVHFGASREGRVFGCFLFAAGGAVVAKFMVGHVTLGFYVLYPLFLYLSYRLSESPKKVSTEIAYFALFIYAGLYKPNFFIYGIPILFLEHVVRALLLRRPRIVLYFIVGVLFSAGTAAVGLLPSWKYFSDFPRLEPEAISVPLYTFFANLLLPLKAIPQAWYGPHFLQRHEYNLFLGPVVLYLACGGWRALSSGTRRHERTALLVFFVASILIGLGSSHADVQVYSPYTWLRALWPGFSSIRVPTRFWFGAYLVIVVFAALGLPSAPTRRQRQFLVWGALVPLFAVALVNLLKVPVLSSGPQWKPARQLHWGLGWHHADVNDSYRFIREGKGVLECIENMQIYTAPDLKEGPLLMALPRTFERLQATWLSWNRFSVKAEFAASARVSFNLNHSPYWRFEGSGAFIASRLGERLTLSSPEGSFEGEFTFRNPLVREGLLLSLSAWIIFLFYIVLQGFVGWRRRRRHAACC